MLKKLEVGLSSVLVLLCLKVLKSCYFSTVFTKLLYIFYLILIRTNK